MEGPSSSGAGSSGSDRNGVGLGAKKLFVGGLRPDAKPQALRSYFSKYGEVVEPVVVYDRRTGKSRGFGFVTFSDSASAERALQQGGHQIDGKKVEVKKATPRGDNGKHLDQAHPQYNRCHQGGPNLSNGHQSKPRKIFVGGLSSSMTEEIFKSYFESNYGKVEDAAIICESITQRPRGFGFITFESEDAVGRVMESGSNNADGKCFHEIEGKTVEVKVAVPKTVNREPLARNYLSSDYGQRRAGVYLSYWPGRCYLSAPVMPYHCGPTDWYQNGANYLFNQPFVPASLAPASSWYFDMSAHYDAFPGDCSTLDNWSSSDEQIGNNHQGIKMM